ncbi:MAG: Fe-S cluster assembly protein SufD [Bacteriovoracaceae bacterium]
MMSNIAEITKTFNSALIADKAVLPEELISKRTASFEQFVKAGFPTKKDEDWQYTAINDFININYTFEKAKKHLTLEEESLLKNYLFSDELHLVFINGTFSEKWSSSTLLLNDLKIKIDPIHVVTPREFKERNSFIDLNQAFLKNGFSLVVSEGVEKPLNIIHFTTSEAQAHLSCPYLSIEALKSANINIKEFFISSNKNTYFVNGLTDFYIGENAHISHTLVQLEELNAFHYSQIRSQIKRDGLFQSFTLNLGAKLSRVNLDIELTESNASTLSYGIYALHSDSQADVYSQIHHDAPNTNSEQIYKGILDDKSHGVFSGKVFVKKFASKSISKQLNKNLLLSKGAFVDSKPQLLIDNDDVKCNHGTTIGQINEDEVFYLQSRGINKAKASKLIAKAFLNDLILKIPRPTTQEQLMAILKRFNYE